MRKFFFAVLALAAFSSCSSTTDPNVQTPNWVMPKSGSQFRFAIVTTDSGATVSRSESDAYFSIVKADELWAGRKAFTYGWSSSVRQYHVTFEANGDTGYGDSLNSRLNLDIYPTATTGRQTIPTSTSQSGPYTLVETGYRVNQGWESISLGGKTYEAVKVMEHKDQISTSTGSAEVVGSSVTETTLWFIPALGFSGKVVRDIYSNTSIGRTHYTRTQMLAQVI